MSRLALLLGGLVLAAVWAPAARAEEDEAKPTLAAQAEALQPTTAAKLSALAAWCQKKKLYGTRDEILEQLLEFDAGDEAARKRLKYKRDDAGGWVRNPKYKRPRNLAKGGLEEAQTRLAATLGAHWDGVEALCAQAESITDLLWAMSTLQALASRFPEREGLTERQRVLAQRYFDATRARGLVKEMAATADWLRQHHGTSLAVREALGEVERDGLWVMGETARTLDGRAGLDTALAAAKKAETTASAATKLEGKIKLPWVEAAATTHGRVAGTATAEHLAAVAKACEAAGTLFEQALRTAPAWRSGLTFYLFSKKGERATFLAGFPIVENPTLAMKDKLDLVYADGQTLLVRAILAKAQADLAVNEVLNVMLSDTFLKSETPRAWHSEGISRYLAWKITGTRYSINVSGSYAGSTKDRHVPDTAAKWLAQARTHLRKAPAGLQLLLGKGTDTFNARDALVAYAFSIYLIEGHDGLAGEFLKLHHKTKDVDRACREILGMPRVVVEHRLLRWLDEVIAQQEGNR